MRVHNVKNMTNMYGGVATAAQEGLIHTVGLIAAGGPTLVSPHAFPTRAIWLAKPSPRFDKQVTRSTPRFV